MATRGAVVSAILWANSMTPSSWARPGCKPLRHVGLGRRQGPTASCAGVLEAKRAQSRSRTRENERTRGGPARSTKLNVGTRGPGARARRPEIRVPGCGGRGETRKSARWAGRASHRANGLPAEWAWQGRGLAANGQMGVSWAWSSAGVRGRGELGGFPTRPWSQAAARSLTGPERLWARLAPGAAPREHRPRAR